MTTYIRIFTDAHIDPSVVNDGSAGDPTPGFSWWMRNGVAVNPPDLLENPGVARAVIPVGDGIERVEKPVTSAEQHEGPLISLPLWHVSRDRAGHVEQ